MPGFFPGTKPLAVALVALVSLSALSVAQPNGNGEGAEGLVLEGVIVASNPATSIALVRRAGAKRARPVRVGQELDGFVLLEVTRASASFASEYGRVRLSLAGHGTRSEILPEEESEPWIRRDFSKSASRFEKEIPIILSETGLTARVEGGEARGLTLTRLPDGTLLSESGLKLGDVILSINGEPLHSLDSLWGLLARFKNSKELRVIVERKGEVVRLAYSLAN